MASWDQAFQRLAGDPLRCRSDRMIGSCLAPSPPPRRPRATHGRTWRDSGGRGRADVPVRRPTSRSPSACSACRSFLRCLTRRPQRRWGLTSRISPEPTYRITDLGRPPRHRHPGRPVASTGAPLRLSRNFQTMKAGKQMTTRAEKPERPGSWCRWPPYTRQFAGVETA